MTLPYDHGAGLATVRCEVCPGYPALPTKNHDAKLDRCIRCQGNDRRLPLPHPEDHLCQVCRRECPTCQAPTPKGGECRTCQSKCRLCQTPLPRRPHTATALAANEATARSSTIRVVASGERKDRKGDKTRWPKVFFPRSWEEGLCDGCRTASSSTDPVRQVLAAFPEKLLRACGGTAPPSVMDTIRAELRHHHPRQLAQRIERRWYGSWANLPLRREETDDQEAYRPDDVAVWLLAPHPCRARCDDGWVPGDPDRRCPHCTSPRSEPDAQDDRTDGDEQASTAAADRSLSEAVTYRPLQECEGKNGACGAPLSGPYSECAECRGWIRCGCGTLHDPCEGCPGCRAQ